MPPTGASPYSPYVGGRGSFQDALNNNAPASVIQTRLGVGSVEDPFWSYAGNIDTARWNQSFPYQLLILDASTLVDYVTLSTFTLPIPPQELGLQTPFAISTQVTLGGIIEQHNAAPIRNITLSGTTGMWTGKTRLEPFQAPGALGTIFAGTIAATNNLVGAVTGITGSNALAGAVIPSELFNSIDPVGTGSETGYYQFRLLQQFIESYVTAKKGANGSKLRLAFAIWKDQAVYLVTPVSFDMRRSAASPLEYLYSLQLKAWKRISYPLGGTASLNSGGSASNASPNAVLQTLQAISNAQNALQVSNLVAVLQGATGDANNLLEVFRSASAWGKDQLGQVYALADLPDQTVNALKGTVLAATANPNLSPPNLNAAFQQLLTDLGVSSGKGQTRNANPAGAGQNLSTLLGADAAHELNTIFANPKQYYNYFSSIDIGSLSIPPNIQAKITAERARVRAFTRTDFASMLNTVQTSTEQFADFVGAGDATFNKTYNRTVAASTRTPSDNDFEVMFQLNAVIMQMNRLAAYNNLSAVPTNPMDFAAGFFANTQIPFTSQQGKFAVPFPYGSTLETLAIQYLGDIDRWQEIASLNNLRAPFVDETGFTVPLLTNGNGSQVTVASAQGLEVSQLVYLSASGLQRSARHILSITPINGGAYYVLMLDGQPNLNAFTTLLGANLQAFLPGTVNSQMTLYIPSAQAPAAPEFDTPGIPGLNPFQQYFNLGGVDLLLTSTGDLVITPDGDCRLAIGLTNIIQGAWLAFNTPKGNLKRHPEYGFPQLVGQSIADMSASSVLTTAKALFNGDPTYSGVQYASVNITGNTARLFMGMQLAQTNQILPIAFDLH